MPTNHKKSDKRDKYFVIPDADNPELEEQMNVEDEYLAELIRRDNEISFFKQKLENTETKLENTTTRLETTTAKLENTANALADEQKRNEQNHQVILDLARVLKKIRHIY